MSGDQKTLYFKYLSDFKLPFDATREQICAKKRSLSKMYHPDKTQGDPEKTKMMKNINSRITALLSINDNPLVTKWIKEERKKRELQTPQLRGRDFHSNAVTTKSRKDKNEPPEKKQKKDNQNKMEEKPKKSKFSNREHTIEFFSNGNRIELGQYEKEKYRFVAKGKKQYRCTYHANCNFKAGERKRVFKHYEKEVYKYECKKCNVAFTCCDDVLEHLRNELYMRYCGHVLNLRPKYKCTLI